MVIRVLFDTPIDRSIASHAKVEAEGYEEAASAYVMGMTDI
jgi:hypothetical protein